MINLTLSLVSNVQLHGCWWECVFNNVYAHAFGGATEHSHYALHVMSAQIWVNLLFHLCDFIQVFYTHSAC